MIVFFWFIIEELPNAISEVRPRSRIHSIANRKFLNDSIFCVNRLQDDVLVISKRINISETVGS